jgi:CheY-like chemotaxis protein
MQKVERLLLVDDDYVSNMLTEMTIKEMHLFITTFQVTANGQEALDYLEITARTDPSAFPQLILLDLNMPVMDGFEFLEKVTQLKLPYIPHIIVLSSSSSLADLERAAAFPIVGYLNKPVRAEMLLPLLQKGSSD